MYEFAYAKRVGMGANRTRIRELADSQPFLLIRIDSQFAGPDLRVGESEKCQKKSLKSKKMSKKLKFSSLKFLQKIAISCDMAKKPLKSAPFLASTRKLIRNSQFSDSTRIRSAQLESTRIRTSRTRFDSHSQNLDSNPSLHEASFLFSLKRQIDARFCYFQHFSCFKKIFDKPKLFEHLLIKTQ